MSKRGAWDMGRLITDKFQIPLKAAIRARCSISQSGLNAVISDTMYQGQLLLAHYFAPSRKRPLVATVGLAVMRGKVTNYGAI